MDPATMTSGQTAEPDPTPPRSLRWRWYRRVGLTWFVACAVVIAVGVGHHYRSQARLTAYRSQLMAAGERLQLPTTPLVGDADALAAGARFLRAATHLPTSNALIPEGFPASMVFVAPGQAWVGWRQDSVPLTGPLPQAAPTWERWGTLLDHLQPTLSEVKESLEAEAVAWELDPRQGHHMLLPHWTAQKEAMKWLRLELSWRLREAQWAEAHRALVAQLNLVRCSGEFPGALSQRFKQALGVLSFQAMWDAWQADGLSEEQWRILQERWAEVDFIQSMILAAEVERRSMQIEFSRCRQEPPHLGVCARLTNHFANRIWSYAWAWWWSWGDEQAYLEQLQAVLEVARSAQTGGELLAGVQAALPGSEQATSRHVLSRAALDWPQDAFERASMLQVIARLAVAGIALKRYALQHEGDYPSALEALAPTCLEAVPADWMDGLPLRYQLIEKKKFLLYSVGMNGLDEGGDPSPREGAKNARLFVEGKDVVWPWPTEIGPR